MNKQFNERKSLYTTFEKFWAAKKQSHAHQSYIYLITNTVKTVLIMKYFNLK